MWSKVVLCVILASLPLKSYSCKCKNQTLCVPIDGKRSGLEFVGFSLTQDPKIYQNYDWTKLTTAVVMSVGNQTEDFACFAHSKNARITLLLTTSVTVLQNATLRSNFVDESVQKVLNYGLDGINIDFEGILVINSTAYHGLTDLMQSLRVALKKKNSAYTLTMDYVYCPECVYGRTYDYKAIQNYVDYFILMDYDMQGQQSQNDGLCTTIVNSPYWAIFNWAMQFINAGIRPDKLVMAFPWYGYKSPCVKFDEALQICYTECSNLNKGSLQVCYTTVMDYLRQDSMEGRKWNPRTLTPSFTFIDQGQLFQMNYDDPWSLRYKYQLAQYLNVRGVGTWNLNCLTFTDDPRRITERDFMWSVIPTGN